MPMSDKELSNLAELAAERAVRSVLLQMGIDSADPLEAQKDFYLMRQVANMVADSEFRKDMEHVRAWRMSMDSIKSKGMVTAAGIVVSGLLAAVWLGIKHLLDKT